MTTYKRCLSLLASAAMVAAISYSTVIAAAPALVARSTASESNKMHTFAEWDDSWAFPAATPGQATIEFRAQEGSSPAGLLHDITFCFAPQQFKDTGLVPGKYPPDAPTNMNIIFVALGGWSNTQSTVRQGVSVQTDLQLFPGTVLPGQPGGAVDVRVLVNQKAQWITAFVKKAGEPESNYVKLLDYRGAGKLPTAPWKYFSFSSYNNNVAYTNIKVGTLPAESSVSHISSAESSSFPTWSEDWSLPNNGVGRIEFTTAASRDVYVGLSPARGDKGDNSWWLALGANFNATVLAFENISKNVDNRKFFVNAQLPNGVTGGAAAFGGAKLDVLPPAGMMDFRIDINQTSAMVGSLPARTVIVQARPAGRGDFQTLATLGDQHMPAAPSKYFSLSTMSETGVFSNIRVSGIPSGDAPAEFYEESGVVRAVAVGASRILAVSEDGTQLLSYDDTSMAPNPWTPVVVNGLDPKAMPIDAIACGSDQAVYVLAGPATGGDRGVVYKGSSVDGRAYTFSAMPSSNAALSIIAVAAGDSNNVWAVDSDHNVLRHNGMDWAVITKGVASDIAVGSDNYVVSVNTEGEAYSYAGDGKGWTKLPELPQSADIDQIAVGSKNVIYAVDEHSAVWVLGTRGWSNEAMWMPVRERGYEAQAVGYANVSANAGGTVFLIDLNGEIYCNEVKLVQVMVTPSITPGAAPVVSIAPVPVKPAVVTRTVAKKTKKINAKVAKKQAKAAAVKKDASGKVIPKKKAAPARSAKVKAAAKAKAAVKKAPKKAQARAAAKKAAKGAAKPGAKKPAKTAAKKAVAAAKTAQAGKKPVAAGKKPAKVAAKKAAKTAKKAVKTAKKAVKTARKVVKRAKKAVKGAKKAAKPAATAGQPVAVAQPAAAVQPATVAQPAVLVADQPVPVVQPTQEMVDQASEEEPTEEVVEEVVEEEAPEEEAPAA